MEKTKLPTAEEWINNYISNDRKIPLNIDIVISHIEFGKLCAKRALEEALEKGRVEFIDTSTDEREVFDYTDVLVDGNVDYRINKDSILNAFDLNEIK